MSVRTSGTQALPHVWRGHWSLTQLASALLFLFIGVECAVLVAWLPDTVAAWWSGDRAGDFASWYRTAEGLEPAGLYTPRRSLLLHPLTYLSVVNAYRLFTALGIAATIGVAYLAQRRVSAWEGKVAVVLGVFSIPQLHWALRIGHLTPMLALAALGGFLLLRRRPVMAGLCFALLSIKPQYAVVPALYLLWTRNGRALAGLVAGAAVLEMTGFAVVGFHAIGGYVSTVFDWGLDPQAQRGVTQVWQYSWGGFLASIGAEQNPLIVFDLVLLSLFIVLVAWARGASAAALPAAAFGMVLVAPYSNFYDWALLVVGAALLLHARLPVQWFAPVTLVGLYILALSSQGATPYPLDPSASEATKGMYLITPAALAVVAGLALTGEGRADAVRRFLGSLWSR